MPEALILYGASALTACVWFAWVVREQFRQGAPGLTLAIVAVMAALWPAIVGVWLLCVLWVRRARKEPDHAAA